MSTIFAGAGSLILSGVVTAAIMFFEAQRTNKNRLTRRAKRLAKSSPALKTGARMIGVNPDRTVMDKVQDIYSGQRSNIKTILGKYPL